MRRDTIMEKSTDINVCFQEILKNILPTIYDRLCLTVSYIVERQGETVFERCAVPCGTGSNLYVENKVQMGYPWDEIMESDLGGSYNEYQYYLYWEIRTLDALPERSELVIKELMKKFLKALGEGFVDYEMFTILEREDCLEKESVLEHLFSFVEDQQHFLGMFVEDILGKYALPEKNILTQLAAQMYEKRPLYGGICFVDDEEWKTLTGESSEWICLDFQYLSADYRTFCVDNLKELCKLLEINTKETIAICVNEQVKGIVSCSRESDQGLVSKFKSFPQLIFYGYLKWRLYIGGKEWFSYDNGIFKIYSGCKENQWRQELGSLGLEETEMNDILEVIGLLSEESHGTSVVFMEEGILAGGEGRRGEVDRLSEKNRCIKICGWEDRKKCRINLKSHLKDMKGITSIDGAIMADMYGDIYAIGTILDGEAEEAGDVSRGARYNSVKNYLSIIRRKNKTSNMFGVIVSEDGDVNLVIPI